MSSLFEIGSRGLTASQYALAITSKNIANVNSPSYSRLDVQFSEAFGAGFGNGVNVSDVLRIFDDITNKNVQKMTSEFGRASTFSQNTKYLELIFDGKKNGIENAMNGGLNALNNINSNPSSITSRALYLSQINNMIAHMNNLDSQLNTEQNNINTALNADVVKTNQALQQLAQLNNRIISADETERADLLDSREALLNIVSTYIGIETSTDNAGILSINLGNGTPLLNGNSASSLVTSPSASDPTHLDIAVELNHSRIPITSMITHGEMAGQLTYQNNTLLESRNALGRLALVVAQTMNAQNELGIDLNGNLGEAIFQDINTPVATTNRVITNTSNQGIADLTVTIDDASQLTTSDYQLTFDSPTHYLLVRKSDNQMLASGDISAFPQSINADGFSVNIEGGTWVAGDTYTLTPTKYGARDINVAMTDAAKLALGFPVIAASAPGNQGDAQFVLTAITDTTTSAFSIPKQLNPPIMVEFTSATMYQLISAVDNTVIEAGIPYDPTNGVEVFPTPGGFDPGYRVHLSGSSQAGDAFTLNYNINGSGDNRNGLMMANLAQQGTLDNGSLNFNQAYTAISSNIASAVNFSTTMLECSDTMKKQSEFKRNQISAVSLQEETVNLTRFQQTYQASAKIIEAGQKIFDILMSLTRR